VLSGPAPLAGAFTLKVGQQLLGQGVQLTALLTTNSVKEETVLFAPGLPPTLTNLGGAAVTLAQNNTLRGFTVGDTLNGDIVDGGASVGMLTVANVSLTGAGPAIVVDQGGSLNVQIDSLVSTSGTHGVHLGATGSALTGTFTATTGAISGSSGVAFLVGDGNGGLGTGGAVTISYGGSITSASGRAVEVRRRVAGLITFSGAIASTHAGTSAIFVGDNPGGAVVFSGPSKALNTGAASAVSLVNNTGSTIAFTGGGLDIDTTTGVGFSATGGGIIAVTGANNTIDSVSATALSVAATSIDAQGLTFLRISAGNSTADADPVNGVVLSATGNAGGLTITGSGSTAVGGDGSGGVIQNTSGYGILLTNTCNASFRNIRVSTTRGSGVHGQQVVGFTLLNSEIAGSNDDAFGLPDEANLSFNPSASLSSGSGTETSLSGEVTISDNRLTGARFHGIDIFNYAGTISNATISGNIITSATTAADSLGSGVRLIAMGSAGGVASVTRATISGNTIANFPSGGGIILQGGNSTGAGAGVFGEKGSATNIVNVTGNMIAGQAGVRMGTHAIQATVNGRGEGNFNIAGNGSAGSPITYVGGTVITSAAFGLAQVTATIANNVIVAQHTPDFGGPMGISVGAGQTSGITDSAGSSALMQVTISGNSVSQTDASGIHVNATEGYAQVAAKIINNTVSAPLGTDAANGIRVNSGSPLSANNAVYLEISGNTTAGKSGAPGIGLRKEGTAPGTHLFAIKGMTATGSTGVETYVTSLNPASAGGTVLVSASATSGFTEWKEGAGQPQFRPLLLAAGGIERSDPAGAGAMSPPAKETTSDTMIESRAQHRPADVARTLADSESTPIELSQTQLNEVVAAARARWVATGLTTAQRERLEQLHFEVASLTDLRLGETDGTIVRVDRRAGGKEWFVDAAVGSDAPFATVAASTRRHASVRGAAAGRVDLLTALMHEMGHALGLDDSYAADDRDSIMYGWLTPGERRLPATGQAGAVLPGARTVTRFLTAPVDLGTLPAGKTVRVTFSVTIANPTGAAAISSRGTVTADGGISVLTENKDGAVTTDVATLTAIEQPPTAVAVAKTVAEDVVAVFSAADFDGGFVDANGDTVQTLTIVSLPAHGTLKFDGAAIAALAEIPRADIARLTYLSDAEYGGADGFTWNGHDGHSGYAAAAAPMTLTVSPVNDAPAGTDKLLTTVEDAPLTLTAAAFDFTDPNDSPANALLAVKITTVPAAGTLTNNGVAVVAGAFVTKADLDLNRLVFTPAENAHGAAYASLTFQVRDAGGTANGGIDLDESANTLTIDVTALNDAPAGTNTVVTTPEDTAYTFVAADFGFTDPKDTPANAFLAVRIAAAPLTGSLTSNGAALSAGGSVSATDVAAGKLVFTPAANASGPACASFTFQVQDDGGTVDGGADLDASPKTVTINVAFAADTPVVSNATTSQNTQTTAGLVIARNSADGAEVTHFKITAITGGVLYQNDGTTPIASGSFITAAQGVAGLRFTPDTNASTAAGGTFSFAVQASIGDTGLGLSPAATATITVGDTTAPSVKSIRRQAPATVHAATGPVTWRVTFSEPVTGVDAADFALTVLDGASTGAVTTITSVLPDSASVYDVAVNVTGQGALALDLNPAGVSILDSADNPLPDGIVGGEFYIVGVTSVFDAVATVKEVTPLTVSDTTSHRVAQRFTTSADEPLTLRTVAVVLGSTLPAGTMPDVKLYTSTTGGGIDTLVTALDNPTTLVAGDLNVWRCQQQLLPGTTYWLVFGATAGSYALEHTASSGGSGSWLTAVYRAGDVSTAANTAGLLQIAIGATSTPTITSATTASATYGEPFSYQITATNGPTSFAAANLPAGLSLNPTTGVISGAPQAVGPISVALTGTNASGTGAAKTLVLTIGKAPLTVTANDTSRYVGAANPTFTLSYSGFRNGDTAAALDALPTATTTATIASPIGTYPITPSGGSSTKYTFSYVAGTLTVSNEPPPSKNSQRIDFPALAEAVVGQTVNLSATASSGLAVRFSLLGGPATLSGSTLTLTGVGVVSVRATQPGNGDYEAAAAVERSFRVTIVPPPPVPPVPAGGTISLSAGTASPGAMYQWQYNGTTVPGATSSTLTLTGVQPASAGLYSYAIVAPDGTTTTSDPVVVGVTVSDKVIGAAEEVRTDVLHPNGNTYDQLLLEGAGATLTADARQVTRISFIDLSNDIVQVEFSGAGALSLVVDGTPIPAPPANYNQPEIEYVRGHAGVVITGADETSNVSVFSVGRANAVNQSLFRDDVTYDGVANIAFIAIQSANGKFGGVRTGNVEYYAQSGFTGLYAPGVAFTGPVNIGDIQAFDSAQPLFIVGSASNVRITGGNLAQPNGQPIRVDGLTRVTMSPGQTSQGDALPAQTNRGVLEQDGVDVTDLIVVNP
jgi:hypothetical protein